MRRGLAALFVSLVKVAASLDTLARSIVLLCNLTMADLDLFAASERPVKGLMPHGN